MKNNKFLSLIFVLFGLTIYSPVLAMPVIKDSKVDNKTEREVEDKVKSKKESPTIRSIKSSHSMSVDSLDSMSIGSVDSTDSLDDMTLSSNPNVSNPDNYDPDFELVENDLYEKKNKTINKTTSVTDRSVEHNDFIKACERYFIESNMNNIHYFMLALHNLVHQFGLYNFAKLVIQIAPKHNIKPTPELPQTKDFVRLTTEIKMLVAEHERANTLDIDKFL